MNISGMRAFLEALLDSSKATGWAAGQAPLGHLLRHEGLAIASVRRQADSAGLTSVPNRAGEDAVSTLKPVTEEEAHPASLSAHVGLGAQPFHTDGAHLRRVPDVVLLWVLQPSETPTLVWRPNPGEYSDDASGIFLVEPGGEPFFAPAVENLLLRFDPVCMSPADARADRLAASLQSPPTAAVESIAWDAPGTMLAIRNRRVLHARAAIADGDAGRRVFRAAFYESA